MGAHLDKDHRQRQHKTDPEPAHHVRELTTGLRRTGDQRLERHAANRA